jgi:hypothetical protein
MTITLIIVENSGIKGVDEMDGVDAGDDEVLYAGVGLELGGDEAVG